MQMYVPAWRAPPLVSRDSDTPQIGPLKIQESPCATGQTGESLVWESIRDWQPIGSTVDKD